MFARPRAVRGHVKSIVIAGLAPAIHHFRKKMVARVKPAHDGAEQRFNLSGLRCSLFETVSLFALCVFLSGACFGAERSDVAVDAVIAAPPAHSAGIWRTKSQPVFDPAERTLIRRMYMVWDPMPERDLDFVWIPSALRDDEEGKVNGVGRLIWRVKGKPAYDPASIFAEYRGVMRDGRADGEGTYFDTTGMSYKGSWKAELMDGLGTLMLPGGDEYIGQMRAGKAHGAGRYIEVTGEIFDGSFVEGKREGIGTTTLPDGSSYRSRWVQGQETEDSRRVRLAQSGGQLAQAGGGDVRIGIWVDKSKARERGDLVYAASSSGAQLMIQPDNPRLMSMWKGNGEIELKDDEEGQTSEYGVFSLNRGQLLPLTLVVEVQNRSAMPIAVAGAYLAVGSSVSDLQPAIQLNRALTICAEAPYKPTFQGREFRMGPCRECGDALWIRKSQSERAATSGCREASGQHRSHGEHRPRAGAQGGRRRYRQAGSKLKIRVRLQERPLQTGLSGAGQVNRDLRIDRIAGRIEERHFRHLRERPRHARLQLARRVPNEVVSVQRSAAARAHQD